jgi:hypothetical protein
MATHKVTFLPLNKTVEVDDAKYPLADHGKPGSLLDIALANDITWSTTAADPARARPAT